MAADDKIIITADEAESVLRPGDYIHNFADGGGLLIGCDYDRADAIQAFRAAKMIEIGGPGCKAMKHPIVVHEQNGRHTFFEADVAKVEELERSKIAGADA